MSTNVSTSVPSSPLRVQWLVIMYLIVNLPSIVLVAAGFFLPAYSKSLFTLAMVAGFQFNLTAFKKSKSIEEKQENPHHRKVVSVIKFLFMVTCLGMLLAALVSLVMRFLD
ncbi:hypothetical protein ACFPAF_16805 [Hymenobacter endophyticus]|uniref:DUF1345 domain-containing protein n=1 Tax=Hymenobacter endophyticus TaxID=3076335 RepID=A0ABU3TL26_9BACT|nr:hypothetical protein [Hymenobacter endophyticus]MDU0372064.1 hypothetical protein [Hymenobacter endophyticus]